MDWKKVLKLDRIKLDKDKARAKELEEQNPFNLDAEERAELRQTNSAKLRAKEQAHLDGREEKRKKMGLRGNISLPRDRKMLEAKMNELEKYSKGAKKPN